MTNIYVKQSELDCCVRLLETAADNCTDASIAMQLSHQALNMRAIVNNPKRTLEPIAQNPATQLQVAAIIADRKFEADKIQPVSVEYVPARFPCMVRKMWSGGERIKFQITEKGIAEIRGKNV